VTDAIQKAREALIANGFDTHTRAIADEFMPETGGRDKAALQIAILDAAAAAIAALDAETEVKVPPVKTDRFAYWNSLPESEKAKIRQDFHNDMYGGADD